MSNLTAYFFINYAV